MRPEQILATDSGLLGLYDHLDPQTEQAASSGQIREVRAQLRVQVRISAYEDLEGDSLAEGRGQDDAQPNEIHTGRDVLLYHNYSDLRAERGPEVACHEASVTMNNSRIALFLATIQIVRDSLPASRVVMPALWMRPRVSL